MAVVAAITPELTPDDAIVSILVATMMPFEVPVVGTPTFKFVKMTVRAVLALIVRVAVVTTIWVLVGDATEPVGPLPLIDTPGVPDEEKKPVGYVSVMVLPGASAPPAVVVNANVAVADTLPATRSDVAIANEVLVT